jgi:putative endonuclease
MTKTAEQILGNQGESFVDHFLTEQGWTVLQKNYRTRFGELDLVAIDQEALVFVEVKTRSKPQAFEDFPALSHAQERRILKTARHFIYLLPANWEIDLGIQEYRFDTIWLCKDRVIAHHRDLLLGGLMRRF